MGLAVRAGRMAWVKQNTDIDLPMAAPAGADAAAETYSGPTCSRVSPSVWPGLHFIRGASSPYLGRNRPGSAVHRPAEPARFWRRIRDPAFEDRRADRAAQGRQAGHRLQMWRDR